MTKAQPYPQVLKESPDRTESSESQIDSLIATGLMLAFVLLVTVGEEAQEMQLAGWLPATEIPALAKCIPSWMGFWLSVVPTAESLCAQALAGLLILGSYLLANARFSRGSEAAS